jgi:hypothetical protein
LATRSVSGSPEETLDRLLPTIRADIIHEQDRIRDAEFENHSILRESDDRRANAAPLARFLDIPAEKAQEIVEIDYLFAD